MKMKHTASIKRLCERSVNLFLPLSAILLLLFSNGRYSIFIATWISAALLLRWARRYAALKGFLIVWLLLTGAWTFQFYGMVPLPFPFFLIIAIVYGLIGSLPYLMDLLLTKQRDQFLQTLIFPASWAIIEFLLQYTPYGSWGHTAYSQYTQLALIQSVSLFGMSYITFLIGWFASICNWAIDIQMNWIKIRKGIMIFGSIILITLLFGNARLHFQRPQSETIRIASISALEKPDQKTDPELLERFYANKLTQKDIELISKENIATNEYLFEKSEIEARAGAEIIFWGEANGVILKQKEDSLFQFASNLSTKHNIYLGLGLGTMNPASDKPLENKLVLFNPKGEKSIDYWKAKPVPGPEKAISAIKDTYIQTTETPYGKIGSAICFDMDFPQHLSQAKDLDILLVPSNDWKAIDPWHTQMAKFRAIEQGFNMVRHTSNGLSAGYDYTGKVLSEMDHYTNEERVLITMLPTKGVSTLYSFSAFIFPVLCMFLILFIKGFRKVLYPSRLKP
jgi:apolipoprotein N-acyltransferase